MNRALHVRVPGLLVVILALVVSVVPAASAWEPQGGAVFNNPKGPRAAQYKIVNAITRAVQGAPRGSTILMSAYMFDNGGTYNALMRAHGRGVHVQMVLDSAHARNGRTHRLAARFNRDNERGPQPGRWGPDQSFLVFCQQACRGANGYNHTKFYAFSRSGTADDVVMVSSSNPNAGGAIKGWNDMYVAKRKPRLFEGFARVLAEMAEDSPNDGDRFMQFREGNALAQFYPKRTGAHPVMADLNRVRCRGATGGAGVGGRTAIRVSMFRWNRKWGKRIAQKLVSLADNGCRLDIIYGAPSRELRLYLTDAARRSARISLWDSRFDPNGNGEVNLRVHTKYLLVSGVHGGDRSSWRVTTGSQNWGASLRTSDENTITIDDRAVHAAYVRNWQHVVNTSARRID
ncbi:MAG TPA: phospholipase D-like domain-containing protein [Marmoricola sp.]|nr:phospholipase D-like domain-containing protein [Marmoricola sp.]